MNTSRKHGKKEPQSFVQCGSFDHPDLHSLNDYNFVFFGLPTEVLGIWGLLIYRWKGIENTFPTVHYMPPKFKNYSRKTQEENMQSFSDCKWGWSKELQWTNNCGSFLPCFLLVEIHEHSLWTYGREAKITLYIFYTFVDYVDNA